MKNNKALLLVAFAVMILSSFLFSYLTYLGLGFGYVLFAIYLFPDKKDRKYAIRTILKMTDSLIFATAGFFLAATALRREAILVFLGIMFAFFIFRYITGSDKWITAVIYSELWGEETPKLINKVQELNNTNVELHNDNIKFKKMAMTYRRNLGICKKAIRHRRML